MDPLERFIKNNKEAFDGHDVSPDLWDGIATRIPKKQKSNRTTLMKVAAVLLILCGISWFTWNHMQNQEQMTEATPQMDGAFGELEQMQAHYAMEIREKIKALGQESSLSEDEKQEFLSILDEMDAEYDVLKRELAEDLANEKVMEAMIRNYRKRLEILEKLMNRITKSKKQQDESKIYL